MTHLLPSLKANGTANSAHGSTTKLHSALLDVLPVHLTTPPAAEAAESEQQTVLSGSVPAQVNLATSLLVNGQALKALKLISPICRAAFGLPDGVAIKAFCVAIEARLQLGALQVQLATSSHYTEPLYSAYVRNMIVSYCMLFVWVQPWVCTDASKTRTADHGSLRLSYYETVRLPDIQ